MTANFQHHVPALRLHHGDRALDELGREVARAGCGRAVVVCGKSLGLNGHALDRVRDGLGDLCAGVLPLVRAHSPLADVKAVAEGLRHHHADAVIALGGGSSIVTGRAAAILLGENRDARDLCTVRDAKGVLRSPRLGVPKLPQFVIPTTPTTAIVKAGSAVLDPDDDRRLALFDPKTRAQAVFIDPYLIGTPPLELVISASLNTLTMATEGLLSKSGDPMSDAYLMHSLRLLFKCLLNLTQEGDDLSARSELMVVSIMCGHATDYTGAGIAIPLGHALSARFQLDNGITNALVLSHVLRYNAASVEAGIAKIAASIGADVDQIGQATLLDRVIARYQALFDALALPRRLRDLGVTRESLPDLANLSMDDWFVQNNPRKVQSATELEHLLYQAW